VPFFFHRHALCRPSSFWICKSRWHIHLFRLDHINDFWAHSSASSRPNYPRTPPYVTMMQNHWKRMLNCIRLRSLPRQLPSVCSLSRAGRLGECLNNWWMNSLPSSQWNRTRGSGIFPSNIRVGSPCYAVGLLFSHAIAMISPIFLLVYRHRRFQLYWDDLWVFIALICDIFLTALLIVRSVPLRELILFTMWRSGSSLIQPICRWQLCLFSDGVCSSSTRQNSG